MNPTEYTRVHLKPLALAMALGVGLSAGHAHAQAILEVGGSGTIGDTTLATTNVPAAGVTWTAAGGEGFKYSSLVSPPVTVGTTGPVTLEFDHRYFIEKEWDGGAVYVSVNGTPAAYLPETAFSANGYIGDTLANENAATPNADTAWPGGEKVFYDKSADYDSPALIESVANLGTLNAGDTVSVHFRGGWDGGYFEPTTNWEMGAVRISDAGGTLLDVDFTSESTSGFTAVSDAGLAGPWVYLKPVSIFELDADTLTADRYAPATPGTVIDLNGANLEVVLLTGTLSPGDTFTLFDLSGGTTLTGTCGSLSLPPGTWDVSKLAVDGTITLRLLPRLLTPGADFEVDARSGSNGNDLWEDVIGTAGIEFFLDTANGVGRVATISSTQLTHAYEFPGGLVNGPAEGGLGGAKLVRTGDATGECYSFQDGPLPSGGWDTKDTTIEIWFMPGNLTPTPANGQILYEDGGGIGLGLFLANNQIYSSQDIKEPASQIAYNLSTDPLGLLIAPATTEFIQVVVTRVASGATEMFVNGTSVGTSSDNDGDWTGGDGFGLGARGEANAGGLGGGDVSTESFNGQIALFRVYTNQILTPTEVANNFEDLAGPDRFMAVNLTDPIDEFAYPIGVPVGASATITDAGTPPYTAEFWLDGSLAGTATTSDPYTLDLGVLAEGSHEVYFKVTDSATPNPLTATSATHSFTVATPTDTTATLASSANPSVYGEATVTATVVANNATPLIGGTVQFFDGGDALGSPVAVDTATGTASYSINTLGAGTHSITATYSGFGVHNASSASALSQVVNKAPLTVTATNVFRPTATANPDPLPYKITGYQNGENLASSGVVGEPLLTTDASTGSPAGDYAITSALGDLSADNYSFTLVNGILTVAEVPDTFSVNFYAYGALPTDEAKANVLVAPGVPAGVGDWLTSGWTNIVVPWNPGTPQPPATLTSNRGSSATFVLTTCRNGGPYLWATPRTTLLGDGNGNMMDGHVNSTLNESEWFDMEVTDIPFAIYDVIFYMGANQAQFGDGTGKIVFNGGTERAFTLQSGAFDGTFTEMVDATTPGNYLVFKGVTGSAFTTRTWGTGNNGFNHIGPFGFQVRAAASDYGTWAEKNYPDADLSDPGADYDGDGVINDDERLFGLDPTNPASLNPISVPLDGAAGTLSFTRRDDALTGMFSSVETSTDLVMWTVDADAQLVAGDPDAWDVETVAVALSTGLLSAPKLFVRVVQDEGVIFSTNFEDDNGGFAATGTPNDWEWGTPNSDNAADLIVTTANGGSDKCWGTKLGTGGSPSGVITVGANSILRSPDIDLTGVARAQLQFAAAVDAVDADTLEVLVKQVGTGALLETITPITPPATSNWVNLGPFAIPAAAGNHVYLEFRFLGTSGAYIGLYIDDVTVGKVLP